MKKIFLMVAIAASMALTSCSTKQSAINDLRALSQEMQIRGDSYSLNDWKAAGQEYYNINQRIGKHAGDYTDAQMEEISELNGRCIRSFTEGAISKVTGAMNMVKGFLKGFVK